MRLDLKVRCVYDKQQIAIPRYELGIHRLFIKSWILRYDTVNEINSRPLKSILSVSTIRCDCKCVLNVCVCTPTCFRFESNWTVQKRLRRRIRNGKRPILVSGRIRTNVVRQKRVKLGQVLFRAWVSKPYTILVHKNLRRKRKEKYLWILMCCNMELARQEPSPFESWSARRVSAEGTILLPDQ